MIALNSVSLEPSLVAFENVIITPDPHHSAYKSYTLSQELGIPFVPSIRCHSLYTLQKFAKTHGFPLWVKPVSGFASQNIFVITQKTEGEA